ERQHRVGGWIRMVRRRVHAPVHRSQGGPRRHLLHAVDGRRLQPPLAFPDDGLSVDRQQLKAEPVYPGTRLGPYEISARIGAGGMGEVYRARDTKLDRDVAL